VRKAGRWLAGLGLAAALAAGPGPAAGAGPAPAGGAAKTGGCIDSTAGPPPGEAPDTCGAPGMSGDVLGPLGGLGTGNDALGGSAVDGTGTAAPAAPAPGGPAGPAPAGGAAAGGTQPRGEAPGIPAGGRRPGTPGASGAQAALVAAHEPAELSLLTYNVHGLPAWIAHDDPEHRLPRLVRKAARFDVVLLQEDFAYHDLVVADERQPFLFRGNGPSHDWPFLQGSGLSILSRPAPLGAPVRAAYGVCNGWLEAANDCFASKGYLMVRLALPNGASLDVWDTHLDAGPGDGDETTRATQLERLARAVEARSAGRAVVVGGDFNLSWNAPRERALLEGFAQRVGLAIAAQTPPDTWRSRLDYVLFRNGGGVALDVVQRGMACDFVDRDGDPLSDHPAIFAKFLVR
jgi:endonuclease/exonuclease/phosphatase family metal-dependent hydrolase